MNNRIRPLLCAAALCVALLASCHPVPSVYTVLNDVESYINDTPDSARAVLQSLGAGALRTDRLRARYALLRMMAMAYHGLQYWPKRIL